MNDSFITAEKYFVDTFVRKERRERLWYELSRPKKRYQGLSRFCHHSSILLNPHKILLSGSNLRHQESFREFVKKNSETCLILSPDASLDRKVCPLCDAIALSVMCLDASIIVGTHFAIVRSEAGPGVTEHYLLVE